MLSGVHLPLSTSGGLHSLWSGGLVVAKMTHDPEVLCSIPTEALPTFFKLNLSVLNLFGVSALRKRSEEIFLFPLQKQRV